MSYWNLLPTYTRTIKIEDKEKFFGTKLEKSIMRNLPKKTLSETEFIVTTNKG